MLHKRDCAKQDRVENTKSSENHGSMKRNEFVPNKGNYEPLWGIRPSSTGTLQVTNWCKYQ